MTPAARSPALGLSLIALAIGFNLPFARLAATFDYPDILRRPPEEILAAFTAGGPALIATWWAFAVAALLLVPLAMAHALTEDRLARAPGLAVAAAIAGAMAGLLQAMGLFRWVFVVPGLAASGDVQGFALIHAFAGVGIGEHLGQLATALHVGLLAAVQLREGRRIPAILGALTAGLIVVGAQEGVALALGANGAAFGLTAVAGYLALTLWLIASALGFLRRSALV